MHEALKAVARAGGPGAGAEREGRGRGDTPTPTGVWQACVRCGWGGVSVLWRVSPGPPPGAGGHGAAGQGPADGVGAPVECSRQTPPDTKHT